MLALKVLESARAINRGMIKVLQEEYDEENDLLNKVDKIIKINDLVKNNLLFCDLIFSIKFEKVEPC